VNAAEDRPPRRDGPRSFDPNRSAGGGGGDRSRPAPGKSFKRKGSRRGLRGRKRSL
jgi:hypothetical protein